MRTSASALVLALIGSIVLILSADMLFPELLYSDTEAASAIRTSTTPGLATPAMTNVDTATPISVEPATQPGVAIIPVHLSIPSVGIDSPIIGVGTNAKGEMDVPDGDTNNVGWYRHGVKPGGVGTAVFDAHVFAAFEHLAKARVGDDIYVRAADGVQLHFRVTRVATYALTKLAPATLFASSKTRDINLITCAGSFDPVLGTYDHRTIVSATLVS